MAYVFSKNKTIFSLSCSVQNVALKVVCYYTPLDTLNQTYMCIV